MDARKLRTISSALLYSWLAAATTLAAVVAPRALEMETPTPAPTPRRLSLGGVPQPATAQPGAGSPAMAKLTTPEYAPKQLDFGAVWNGQSSKRTFVLKTNGTGSVTVALPRGPYSVVGFRESGPIAPGAGDGVVEPGVGASAVRDAEPPERIFRDDESHITYPAGQTGPWQWNVPAGVEVRIDILFEPKFDPSTMTAGPKPATMTVTGPGATWAWTLSVPLNGKFNGPHVAPLLHLTETEFTAEYPGTTPDLFPPRGRDPHKESGFKGLPVFVRGQVTATDPIIGWVDVDSAPATWDTTGAEVKLDAGETGALELKLIPPAPGTVANWGPQTLTVVLHYKRDPYPKSHQHVVLPIDQEDGTQSAQIHVTVVRSTAFWRLPPVICGREGGSPSVLLSSDGTIQMDWGGGHLNDPPRFSLFFPGLGHAVIVEQDIVSGPPDAMFFRSQLAPADYIKAASLAPRLDCNP